MPIQHESVLVTLHVGGDTFPWVPNVPFPADLDGDLLPEVHLTAEIGDLADPTPSVCFTTERIPGTSSAGDDPVVGVAHDGISVFYQTDEIPTRLEICGEDAPGDEMEASIVAGSDVTEDFAPEVRPTGSGTWCFFCVFFDRVPADLHVTHEERGERSGTLSYEAALEHDVTVVARDRGELRMSLDDMPTQFSLAYDRTKVDGDTLVDLDYTSTGSIDELSFISFPFERWDQMTHVFAYDLPFSLEEHLRIGEDGDADVLEWSHDAPDLIPFVRAIVRGDEVSFAAEITDTPSRLDDEVRLVDVSDRKELRWLHDASWRTPEILASVQTPDTSAAIQLQGLPSGFDLDGKLHFADGTIDQLDVQHSAIGPLDFAGFVGEFGTAKGTVAVRDVPKALDLGFQLEDPSGSSPTPVIDVGAQDPGMDLFVSGEGDLFGGGFVDVQAIDIPERITTTFPDTGTGEAMNARMQAFHGDKLATFFVDAYLPEFLDDLDHAYIQVYMEDVRDLQLSQKTTTYAPCLGCQYWHPRDVGYFQLRHGEMTFGGFDFDIYWGADQCAYDPDTCDALGAWVDAYIVNELNLMVHAPAYLDGPSARADCYQLCGALT